MNKFKLSLISVLLLLFGAEIIFHLSGVVDFPLYEANNTIGYIPKPSQSGVFLRKNAWQFNALSMQNDEEFSPSNSFSILLVGDSIVLGGNEYKKQDRLGRQLAQITGSKVWSISAGSWSLLNELSYIHNHPEVAKHVSEIIFVSNSGDFESASSWACEYSHPRTKPVIATTYLFRKYIYNWSDCISSPNSLRVNKKELVVELKKEFSKKKLDGINIKFFLYPDKKEYHAFNFSGLEAFGKQIKNISEIPIQVYSIGKDSRWNESIYKDGIHPSEVGMKVLADIIAYPDSKSELKN